MKRSRFVTITAFLALSLGACKKDETKPAAEPAKPMEPAPGSAAVVDPPKPTPPAATKTIVETAKDAGSFKTLLAAVEAAGLVDTLNSPGPFTVFAPTDEAFAKIPKADLDALIADKAKLTAVLTYHVVSGKVMAKDVGAMKTAKTVQGGELAIDTSSGVKVGNAMVTAADIEASNGVIHVVDSVLMPPK